MNVLDETKPVCRVAGEFIPAYAYPGDAGADLQAAADVVIPARGKMMVPTGIRLALPENHVGLIWPRSGLAVKHSIDCGAGVIDSQYRGEIKVLLFNHSNGEYFIKKGDRIAQLLVQKVETVEFLPVADLDTTDRNSSGFGSTDPA
ncbi:MAG: dUTP diphosphatase [Nitrospinaceae bacterium]|nr:dUTP diphosphatase [Nitrospinaceae bacterium]NIR57409.1 dUTP diphosphatase [Nitrospinaceae bacterium]NIS87861.1 dUTP diphosphatase [Nitrospinaceae bacterium]NIT84732.1 dUTP diphosphatase [Nitrospinaceae bacterium]NIU46910.1 dUTP diphosphatase [Nitrospinaceae bacterium]